MHGANNVRAELGLLLPAHWRGQGLMLLSACLQLGKKFAPAAAPGYIIGSTYNRLRLWLVLAWIELFVNLLPRLKWRR